MFGRSRFLVAVLTMTLLFSVVPVSVFGTEKADTAGQDTIEVAGQEADAETAEEPSEEEKKDAEEAEQADSVTTEDSSDADADKDGEAEAAEKDAASEQEETDESAEAAEDSEQKEETDGAAAEETTEEADEEVESEGNAETAGNETAAGAAETTEESAPAAAETTAEDGTAASEITINPGPESTREYYEYDLGDSDERFEQFANRLFYGSSNSGKKLLKSAKNTGYRLTGNDLAVYTALRTAVTEISQGNRDSGVVGIPYSDYGVKEYCTADDLGLEYLYDFETGTWNSEFGNALTSLFECEGKKVQSCLTADCAFEMFPLTGTMSNDSWADYEAVVQYDEDGNPEVVVQFTGSVYYYLKPTSNFLDTSATGDNAEYAIDADKIKSVLNAAENAGKIVTDAAGKSDLEKLTYYKDQIIGMVDYDDAAAEYMDNYADRNVWTLINVFDGDDDTKAVCEGYAEAFQYLCDQTDFSDSNICAYSVTGTMGGGTGSGPHKWNIVHMDDDCNYIADITNTDTGSVGSDGKLFLKGMIGSPSDGYTKSWDATMEVIDKGDTQYSGSGYEAGQIVYQYDSEMFDIYTEGELTLSSADYGQTETSATDIVAPLYGMSLFLTDKIGMQVLVKEGEGYSTAVKDTDYLLFTRSDGTQVKQTISDASMMWWSDGTVLHVFELPLYAKQMTEEISFQMYVGGAAGTKKTYSVRSYADEVLKGDNYSEDNKAMVRAMLNYGGYTQEYFSYNTDNLANTEIFETNPVSESSPDLSDYAYTLNVADDTHGFNIKEAALTLGTDISLKVYYTLDEGVSDTAFSFTLDPNNSMEYGYNDEKKMQYVKIEDIKPYELNNFYNLKVAYNNSDVVNLSYSPLSYCNSKLSRANASDKIKNLCKSIYLYWESATVLHQ